MDIRILPKLGIRIHLDIQARISAYIVAVLNCLKRHFLQISADICDGYPLFTVKPTSSSQGYGPVRISGPEDILNPGIES